MGVKTKVNPYYETIAQAVSMAFQYAEDKGYKVEDEVNASLSCGESLRKSLILSKDNMPVDKCLQLQIYRMDSGRYELNYYIR